MNIEPLQLYVAVGGDDQADGSRKRPLATPRGARDAVRRWRSARSGVSAAVTVWFESGTYHLTESLVLEEQDSGTEQAPVLWRACPGAEVRFSGGCSVDGTEFRPVSDPSILSRFDAPVRSRLIQLDLKALGITDTHVRIPRGFGFGLVVSPSDLDVYFQDRPLPMARWPRTGYALTGTVLDTGTCLNTPGPIPEQAAAPDEVVKGGTFTSDSGKIRRWSRPRDLECFGMWAMDWAPATLPVKSTDPECGTITLDAPSYRGVLAGRRYYVRNALEEIAQPGYWAVDRDSGILYLDPPVLPKDVRLTLSVLKDPLVILKKARWIHFRQLIFEGGRFHGMTVEGDHNEVAGCILRNLGGRGITVEGRDNRVQSCHIYQTGQGGIYLNGGDRRTLEPGRNIADNCEIHDFNRVCKAYNPAVWFAGCGNVMRHNRIYDGPHNAILLWGNDHLIEANDIGYVGLEIDDAAAFYMGRNPSEQGNILRHNYFHHVGCPTGWGTSAIYPDDGSCGLTVVGNVFYRCGHAGQVCMGAIFNNGGKDHRIDNNIFVDCGIAFGNMQMGAEQWLHFVRGDTPATQSMRKPLYEEVDIRSEVYLRRYPWLKDLESNPGANIVRRNLAVRCGVMVTPEDWQTLESNRMTREDPGFVDLARLNFTLKPDSAVPAMIPGFEPIPFAEIGLRPDEYRPSVPGPDGVDCRPELISGPEVQRPGDWAAGELAVHLVNLSDRPVSGTLELWTTHPEAIRFKGPGSIAYTLSAREVRCETVAFEGCARPDLTPMIGARAGELDFSLPVPVRFRYPVKFQRGPAVTGLTEVAGRLADAPEWPFLRGGSTVGTLRARVLGDTLALTARVHDRRPISAVPAEANWNGPYVGILVAPADATSPAAVHQLVCLPQGSEPGGTTWFFIGHRQVEAAETIRWAATPLESGWELSALVPLATLGLTPATPAFRFEAMVNLTLEAGAKPVVVTLFGSKTARLEIDTMAEARLA